MGETATAVFLRMSYVAASVLFVLVVNRFFFPTSLRSQFRYNLQMLFHMHHMYLRILEDALTNPPDYWRICDAQLQYHMVHGQIKQERGAEARHVMERYIYYTDYVLNLIQEMLHLKKEKRIKNISGMQYQRYIEGEPELSRLMDEYARNLSSLYVLVLQKYQ